MLQKAYNLHVILHNAIEVATLRTISLLHI